MKIEIAGTVDGEQFFGATFENETLKLLKGGAIRGRFRGRTLEQALEEAVSLGWGTQRTKNRSNLYS